MASFLPGVAYPGVRDNRSTINTKTGYEKNEKYFIQFLKRSDDIWYYFTCTPYITVTF